MHKMNLDRIDLNLFVVFRAIHAEGNLTRAARSLHLSQPALSHALARLREALADPLFVRQGHAMVPTPKARSLIGPVRQALQVLEQHMEHGPAFDPAASEWRFTLGMRPVLESVMLPPLMQQLMARAPGVTLNSVTIERDMLAAELASGRLDLAVDVALPLPAVIQRQRLGQDRLVVLARPGRLAGPLTPEAYRQARHVAVSGRRHGPALEDLALRPHNLRRQIALRCQHYMAACQVVACTDLLLTMPASYADIVNRSTGNALCAVPLELPPVDLCLYWHENATHSPASRWLREMLLHVWEARKAEAPRAPARAPRNRRSRP